MIPQASIGAVPHRSGNLSSLLSGRWTKLLVPSLSDLLFIALIGWLFMSTGAHGWQSLLVDADVGWHIRTGEYILDHHNVPRTDLYSFSKPAAPWFAWEWLADVADAVLFRMAGLKGVVLAAGILIVLFATILMRRIVDAGTHLFAALLVTLLSVGSASMHFLARPHVFTLVLLSLSMGLIEADRRGANPARLWWLVPITMVWTNLHGGFLILVAILGLTTVGAAIEAWVHKTVSASADWRPAVRWAKLTAACAAVSLVNPYGWGLHRHVVEYLRSDWIRKIVQEFQSPTFRDENMLQFEALLFIGLIAAGACFRRAKVTEGLWILFLAYLSLSSVRHVPIFVTAVGPLIALELTSWWQGCASGATKNSALGILNQMGTDLLPGFQRTSAWCVIAVAALVVIGKPIPWPADFPEEIFPAQLIHAHEQQILHSRVLTTDQWADYLIYLHPEQKVFVDGRSDFYGPQIGDQFLHVMSGAPDWEQVMRQYQFNLVLIPGDIALAQLLKARPEWREVGNDGKRILLVLGASPVLTTRIPVENQGSKD
jgi:hypothetical protein